MSDREDQEEAVYSIDDPIIPDEVRAFASEFIEEVCWVAIEGREYWLLDADFELIDICWFK
ncbi:hypothetical protein CO615_07055 [Lysobacteraceae bacterium NML75-0749]|nr:hypothetical protein CO615_07055 [Xanthomonadaceae bacterium NML75-0749]PJK05912.1 hypothetical protein CO609_02985 [Xanthomonadaceae bacterium NML91-0268]PJK06460.1 hypothetical protein CO612_02465 [Xanthomonadaceae bacterium NML71-0210]